MRGGRAQLLFHGTRGNLRLPVTCPKLQSQASAEAGLVAVSKAQLAPEAPRGLGVIQGKSCRVLQPVGHFKVSPARGSGLEGRGSWGFWSERGSLESCWLGLVVGF